MHHALENDETYSQEEREARTAGRAGSVGGAAAGFVGGIGAVSTAGSVAGLTERIGDRLWAGCHRLSDAEALGHPALDGIFGS